MTRPGTVAGAKRLKEGRHDAEPCLPWGLARGAAIAGQSDQALAFISEAVSPFSRGTITPGRLRPYYVRSRIRISSECDEKVGFAICWMMLGGATLGVQVSG